MLNTMLANRQITPAGLDWLTVATDPFHDTEISPPGFPDADSSRSIPQLYQFTGTLTAPATLVASTWDAHVTFCPISYGWGGTPFESSKLSRRTINPVGTVANTSLNGYFFQGGYNAHGVQSGLNVIQDPALGVKSVLVGVSYPASASSGQFRLVAAGCEIVNTTPDLYRGGSVTNYRSPNCQRQGVFDVVGPVPNNPCTIISLPPGSQTDAQLYPTAKTWGAEDGTYLVATLDSSLNDYSSSTPGHVVMANPFDGAQLLNSTAVPAFITNESINGIPANCFTVMPFDWSGAIFTGLTPQTTLQVSVRYYVERIPTITQPDLLVLTRLPTPYDPTALEIYSRCLSELPVAVRVDENPLGEWFNDIMDMVGTWAPRIGNGLGTFIPGASAIGNAVGGGASALGRLNRYGGNTVPAKKPKKDESVTNKNAQNTSVSKNQKRRKPRNRKKRDKKSK